MKMITMYLAWDGTEFNNYHKCRDYERKTLQILSKINDCITFDTGTDALLWFEFYTKIEEMLDALEGVWNDCTYLDINKELDEETKHFITEYLGYGIPTEIGRYWFDDARLCWEKVS